MKPLPVDRVYLSHTISEPAFGDTADSIFYLKLADGRRSIVRQSVATGLAQAITTEPAPKGGVSYGGGGFCRRGERFGYGPQDGTRPPGGVVFGGRGAAAPGGRGRRAPAAS